MKPELVSLSKIKPNPDNPRTITGEKYQQLVRSIREFPEMLQLRPIVVDENNITLGGNMRLRAAKEAGLKKTWVIKASELTQEQMREFIVKDNVGYGEWDYGMLAVNYDIETLEHWGLAIPDLTPAEGMSIDEVLEEKPKKACPHCGLAL